MNEEDWMISLDRDQLICPWCAVCLENELESVMDNEGRLIFFSCAICGYKKEANRVARAIYREGWKAGIRND